jgi:hypothetical protein
MKGSLTLKQRRGQGGLIDGGVGAACVLKNR